MSSNSDGKDWRKELLEATREGDKHALGIAFELHREKLRRTIAAGMDWRLHAREDPEDILSLTYVEAEKRFSAFLANDECPFFVWLLGLARQVLSARYRYHLACKRSMRRERTLRHPRLRSHSDSKDVEDLVDPCLTPGRLSMRSEDAERVQRSLMALRSNDRRVLVLIYFAGLSGPEAANYLGVEECTLRKRHERALRRFRSSWEA